VTHFGAGVPGAEPNLRGGAGGGGGPDLSNPAGLGGGVPDVTGSGASPVLGSMGGLGADGAPDVGAAGGTVSGRIGGIASGGPSVDGAASFAAVPAAPNVQSFSPQDAAIGAATDASGAGETVAHVQSVHGSAETAQGFAGDPSGSAAAEVSGRATTEVSARAPIDPGGVTGQVDELRGTVDDPEAAAAQRLRTTADARVDDSVNVHVEGSVTTPPIAPKK
jgi:hypothetical protein